MHALVSLGKPGEIALFQGSLRVGHSLFEQIQESGRDSFRGQFHGKALELHTNDVELIKLLDREHLDEVPLMRPVVDKPFRGEPANCIADRRSTDAECGRKIPLVKTVARRYIAVEDELTQPLVHALVERSRPNVAVQT